ncbi:MAG TPA: hypothetical protein VHE55_19670 [Fimbriimonadaceae bacterium]|nr:hypothetical protein [Fimbriimonadaceae bacterium]
MTSDPIARYLSQRTAKMDRRNRLRLMTGNEIIDVAIRVYQVLGWTFLKSTIVPSLFCLASVTFFLRYVWPSYFVTKSPGSQSAQILEMVSTTGLALFVAAPLFILGVSYTQVLVANLVSDYMVGNVPSSSAADEKGRELLPKLFWLNLREVLLACSGILVSLGLLALAAYISSATTETDATAGIVVLFAWLGFAAGGIFFLAVVVRHSLAPVIMALEGKSIGEAAKRSVSLLKTYGMHSGGYSAVTSVMALLLLLWMLIGGGISISIQLIGLPDLLRSGVSGLPFSSVFIEALGLLPTFLVMWTLTPVWAATTTIIYYDRRIRLEGYDIEALAEDVWRADRSRRFEL